MTVWGLAVPSLVKVADGLLAVVDDLLQADSEVLMEASSSSNAADA